MDVWSEKYRAHGCDDFTCPPQAREILASLSSEGGAGLQHMILYGPPGSGKSTAALAVCRDLFGTDGGGRVLRLNASVDRGIQSVRDKMKRFASASLPAPVPGFPSPPIKVLLLEESDRLTHDAQCALRKLIEDSANTRFCFTCNHVSHLIEPIASRCRSYYFRSLPDSQVRRLLQHVCRCEGVAAGDVALDRITAAAAGDARRAVNLLQGVVADDVVDTGLLGDVLGELTTASLLRKLGDLSSAGEALHAATALQAQGVDGAALARHLSELSEAEGCHTLAVVAFRLLAASRGCGACTMSMARALRAGAVALAGTKAP